uniref:mRNA-degrading endonuclease RelE, toxin component of the RelBE toxin-antitoxin system n=1 Tax=Candidatus Kentrum sp. FM TaxID=2126340 RepID=A0A450SZL7_9GAMM|nr:MAG: mRNA-degrading endonuclease RelE, toxin component of the RelBE toxin-antitoxin system [Candidatus Kentron sp. FM]VFJ60156.1 MAG: mRNA-degrading endonuclease RelE, toxin component of the RelBE toxin-antitoxin system [Candidatus Kentron sp. FM]VFK12416.1 MAG: mRNA-degrading endonuclease RelE, toxin component of the RelBE toxin-antitoxin system [Candidatus Kentron sp. FM]
MAIHYCAAFKRQLRRLSRKYRHIRSDLQPIIVRIEAGETPGDRIPSVGHIVYKVRAPNSDAGRGKTGGYRIIYLHTEENIVLISIYSKTEQSDIEVTEIARIIREEDTSY